jgi:putative oxidoreductase
MMHVMSEVALACVRVGIGSIFTYHGFLKLMGGQATWMLLGQAMANFGITSGFLYWGCAAMIAEFVGGMCLAAGFCTRVAAFFIACVMCVAIMMHIKKGDSWTALSHPLSLLVVMIGFMIAGSGPYSLDAYLRLL